MSTLRDAFWVFVLGVIVCFAFFFALGAVTTEAVGLMAVIGGLTVLWLVHMALATRRHDTRDVRLTGARERRGF